MKIDKLTTLLVVDAIEASLPTLEKMGYEPTVRVPEKGKLGFVILTGTPGELMLQTRESLAEDLPAVAALHPGSLLYADVESVDAAARALGARVIVPKRTTFYGAHEIWVELAGGHLLGLSEHAK
jgi:hypothetical protein